MEGKRSRRAEMPIEEIDQIEQRLALTLSPIQPRTEFVETLHSRLTTPMTVVIENPTHSTAALIVGMGLFFGVLLFWLLRRMRPANG